MSGQSLTRSPVGRPAAHHPETRIEPTEFGKYGDVLDKVQKKLQEASSQIDQVAVRRRAIDRKLRDVELLPRVMQFCHGDLSLPCRAGVPATYGNGSVEVRSVIDGGRPDAVWFAACRARRNP